jgi:hypothetical protein
MKINARFLLLSVVTICLSGFWLVAGGLPVTAAQVESNLSVTYEVQTNRQGDTYVVLVAKLTRDDGYPLSQRNIAFFETADTFGTARISLGSAITTAVGIASLRYETRVTGEHHFTVLFNGDEATALAIVNTTLDMQNLPAVASLEKPVGMEEINRWTMTAVGVVVLVVFGLLAWVFFGTLRGIRKHSKA